MDFTATNTFCISLEGHPRWDRMKQRLKTIGLEVTRWNASTPSTLTDSFVDSINPSAKACAQSHVNVWRHMVHADLPYALILEDDAMVRRDWIEVLSRFDLGNDPDWDAIFLNASESANPAEQWVPAREQFLTAGYILSIRGARKLLDRWSPCYPASDWMTSRLQEDGHCYTIFPWLIVQEGRETTIGGNLDADHAKVVRLLAEAGYSLSNYL